VSDAKLSKNHHVPYLSKVKYVLKSKILQQVCRRSCFSSVRALGSIPLCIKADKGTSSRKKNIFYAKSETSLAQKKRAHIRLWNIGFPETDYLTKILPDEKYIKHGRSVNCFNGSVSTPRSSEFRKISAVSHFKTMQDKFSSSKQIAIIFQLLFSTPGLFLKPLIKELKSTIHKGKSSAIQLKNLNSYFLSHVCVHEISVIGIFLTVQDGARMVIESLSSGFVNRPPRYLKRITAVNGGVPLSGIF